jgi:hypothetical protein
MVALAALTGRPSKVGCINTEFGGMLDAEARNQDFATDNNALPLLDHV